jgi:hypothetical protein
VRADVVVGDPDRDLGAGVVEVEEQRLLDQFVSYANVEALGEGIRDLAITPLNSPACQM